MSARDKHEIDDETHPRRTLVLFGHHDGEQALLDAYKSGRIPHAWLIAGAQGIGKATLSYRMARFVLAHPDPMSNAVKNATSLAIDDAHPVARQVAAGSHGGLLTLERTVNDKGVLRQVITIDESRETISFFGSTASANGWRVCVVDSVDELNGNAANALLKVLEEPPLRSLFLLVSNSPARLLPTIRSRCRKLSLRPLDTGDVVRAVANVTDVASDDPALREAAEAAEGSVSRALNLMGGDTLKMQQRVRALLDQLPQLDQRQLHALGDALPLNDRIALAAFTDSIDRWIGSRLNGDAGQLNANLPRLARLAEVWDKIISAARETESYNLERKPLVFSAFGLLAEATA